MNKSPFWLWVVVAVLLGCAWCLVLMLPGQSNAQPSVDIAPSVSEQIAPFLSVPYYGAKPIYSYVDHHPLGASWNYYDDVIETFDGQTAIASNGVCGSLKDGRGIAYYTQPYSQGVCLWYDAHNGYDFPLVFEPILAPADGNVTHAGWNNWSNHGAGLGLYLQISHTNGYMTRYGHLSAITAVTNALVTRGQIIATSGNSGFSSGAHLHFEVLYNNIATDPFGGSGAEYLWQDGHWNAQDEWVGQTAPAYGASYIVDDDNPAQVGAPDDDPGFTKGHTIYDPSKTYISCPPDDCPYWFTADIGHDGDMLYTYRVSEVPDYWAKWIPPHYGTYDVQVWIPGNYATTWEARYWWLTSYNYMPVKYMVVDQSGVSNQWISLGIHQFGPYPEAPWYALWLNDQQTVGIEKNRMVGVDAIRFREVVSRTVYLPMTWRVMGAARAGEKAPDSIPSSP